MKRREYKLFLIVNNIIIDKVIIDSHYEQKHGNSMNDGIILELIKTLHGEKYIYESENGPFRYFMKDRILYGDRLYKLIWMMEKEMNYIGVINAYRR